MTTARDIMTSQPKVAGVGDSIEDIAKMLAADDIGAVVVCNDQKRLQGVITDRDIAVEVVAKGRDPKSCTAADVVAGREVVTIGADDSLDVAVQTMKQHAVRRLPVIDGTELVGVVSQADLARALPDSQVGDLLGEISASPDNTGQG